MHLKAVLVITPTYFIACRCGSTLICQMMDLVPETDVLIEPWPFSDLGRMALNQTITMAEHDKLLVTCMRLVCKPLHNRKIKRILIKICPVGGNQHFPFFLRAFPKFKVCPSVRSARPLSSSPNPFRQVIFNTRLLKDAVPSFVKTVDAQPKFYRNVTNGFYNFWWGHSPIPLGDPKWASVLQRYTVGNQSFAEKMGFTCASFYGSYLANKERYTIVIYYEDIVKDAKVRFMYIPARPPQLVQAP